MHSGCVLPNMGAALKPKSVSSWKTRLRIGSELAAFGQRFGGIDLNITRDQAPAEPATFE